MDKEIVRELFPELTEKEIEVVILNLEQFLRTVADIVNKPISTVNYDE